MKSISKLFIIVLLSGIALNMISESIAKYPNYTEFEIDGWKDSQTCRTYVLTDDSIFCIRWRNRIPNDLYLRYLFIHNDETLSSSDSIALLQKIRENIDIQYIYSAKLERINDSIFTAYYDQLHDPLFSDSTISISTRQNHDSINITMELPNLNCKVGVKFMYSFKPYLTMDHSMQSLRNRTDEFILDQNNHSVSISIPDKNNFLGFAIRLINVESQSAWGEFFGRIYVPEYYYANAIPLPSADITLTLPAVCEYLFTEPCLDKHVIFANNTEMRLHDLPFPSCINFIYILHPYLNQYRASQASKHKQNSLHQK